MRTDMGGMGYPDSLWRTRAVLWEKLTTSLFVVTQHINRATNYEIVNHPSPLHCFKKRLLLFYRLGGDTNHSSR